MSDLIDRVLQFVTDHPLSSATRIKEEIRRPTQEVEACLSALKRQGRVCQAMPGLWTIPRQLREAQEARPDGVALKRPREELNPGMKRCPSCTQILPKADFYASGYCKPCGRLKARENSGKRHGIRAEREVRQPGKTIALRSLKRLRAAVEREIEVLEAES